MLTLAATLSFATSAASMWSSYASRMPHWPRTPVGVRVRVRVRGRHRLPRGLLVCHTGLEPKASLGLV